MPFKEKEKIQICCAWCGKIVKSRPWRKGKIKFCSLKHKYLALKKAMLIKNSLKKKIRYRLICQNFYCNKPFIDVASKVKKRKYCCRACYYLSRTSDYKEEAIRRSKIKARQNDIRNIMTLSFTKE